MEQLKRFLAKAPLKHAVPIAERVRCFVFETALEGDFEDLPPTEVIDNLPFQVVSIELPGGREFFTAPRNDDGFEWKVKCIVVVERSPGDYALGFLFEHPDGHEEVGFSEKGLRNHEDPVRYIAALWKTLPKRHVCSEKKEERLKLGSGNERKAYRLTDVIHVRQQKFRSSVGLFGGVLDFTHRFEVRGHWRQIQGIGRDREGNCCIEGRTWVRPYVKGPPDKPVIVKQRVVHAP